MTKSMLAFMAAIGLAIVMFILTLTAHSQELPTIAGLDLNNVFTRTRAGVAMIFDGNDYAAICAPLISIKGKSSGREYFNFNVGGAKDIAGGPAKFMLSMGWRIDSYFVKFSESEFARKYLLFAVLPPLEVGPSVLWFQAEKKAVAGFVVLTRFGK